MEDFATYYAIVLNNPELREGLIREAERSRRFGQNSSTSRLVRGWLARTLRGLAAHVEPSAVPWSATNTREPASLV